jgi:hypothetical protein
MVEAVFTQAARRLAGAPAEALAQFAPGSIERGREPPAWLNHL